VTRAIRPPSSRVTAAAASGRREGCVVFMSGKYPVWKAGDVNAR
jgi:hypothetical protein